MEIATNLISYMIFLMAIAYYFITTAQWYSYKLSRVIFNHTKPLWNIIYFLIPFAGYEALNVAKIPYAQYALVVVYLIALFVWYKGLDKPLVFTARVKRFLALVALFGIFSFFVTETQLIIVPLLAAWLVSLFIEKMLFNGYKQKAIEKLESRDNLIVIGVTASYGKTSIKNYLTAILSTKYNVYCTPRSVNTLGGVVKDINEDLPEDAEIYVVEMGAREVGDIYDITSLVNPHYAIVGTIGPAHIEYFKTLENIRNTKMEIIKSNRLKKAWVHTSTKTKTTNPKVELFGHRIDDVTCTLNGLCFSVAGERFCANILGKFNAINLTAAIWVAREFGISNEEIQNTLSNLQPVEHRLQKIEAGGKIIIDDSFNGNIDGVLEAFDLSSKHNGRKVVVTPGLVEVEDELNVKVAQKAKEIFDLIVVTGNLNYNIFKKNVDSSKLVHLEDKSKMEEFLAKNTRSGDLILFANDAPSVV